MMKESDYTGCSSGDCSLPLSISVVVANILASTYLDSASYWSESTPGVQSQVLPPGGRMKKCQQVEEQTDVMTHLILKHWSSKDLSEGSFQIKQWILKC